MTHLHIHNPLRTAMKDIAPHLTEQELDALEILVMQEAEGARQHWAHEMLLDDLDLPDKNVGGES